jgi:hypothetical protein
MGARFGLSALREENRLTAFENRMLGTFKPERREGKETWKTLHNKNLRNLYPCKIVLE